MILLLCAVKRGRSPFDTIKNKTKTEKPKPEQKCSPHQAGPGHWFCLPSVSASVCMWRMLPLLPTQATTTLNMTQNNALNRTKTNSNNNRKERRKQNSNNSNGSNNKILYLYFIPKMCPDQGRQRCPDQCNCLPLLVKLRTS